MEQQAKLHKHRIELPKFEHKFNFMEWMWHIRSNHYWEAHKGIKNLMIVLLLSMPFMGNAQDADIEDIVAVKFSVAKSPSLATAIDLSNEAPYINGKLYKFSDGGFTITANSTLGNLDIVLKDELVFLVDEDDSEILSEDGSVVKVDYGLFRIMYFTPCC